MNDHRRRSCVSPRFNRCCSPFWRIHVGFDDDNSISINRHRFRPNPTARPTSTDLPKSSQLTETRRDVILEISREFRIRSVTSRLPADVLRHVPRRRLGGEYDGIFPSPLRSWRFTPSVKPMVADKKKGGGRVQNVVFFRNEVLKVWKNPTRHDRAKK